MKKTILFVAAIATISCFTACSEKEGEYSPKEKIVNIYESSMYSWSIFEEYDSTWYTGGDTSDKQLTEHWIWDGDELTQINQIETYNDIWEDTTYTYENPIKFTYEDGRMVRMDMGYSYATITYDGKKLVKIESFSIGVTTPVNTIEFTYDGKKVSQIKMIENDNYEDLSKASREVINKVFDIVIPDANIVKKGLSRTHKKDANDTTILNLTWDGNNINTISASTSVEMMTITYSYDNKKNPYSNFLYAVEGSGEYGFDLFTCFNENNIVKTVIKYTEENEEGVAESRTLEYNYTYTYDGKWPLTRTCATTYNEETYSGSSSETIYFEYAD